MVKKLITLVAFAIGALLLPRTADASAFTIWNKSDLVPYKAGYCTMVDTPSEADSTHVYTLNPDHTYQLNNDYVEYWNRNARCDELQFHVDHNTTRTRLRQWLGEVATNWFRNIGATHYHGQTVSTEKGEWFSIDANGAHRIPDWLTALSHGLMIEDRISNPFMLTDAFYDNVTFSTPLQFADGQYADEIDAIWHDGNRDYSDVPTRMADEIHDRVGGNGMYWGVFTGCLYQFRYSGDPWRRLLDWSWMLHNDGCPLANT